MRFVWAVLAFVLAALLIGAGIAQRTVFLGPNTQQTQFSVENPAAYTLIDGAVLRTQPGSQSLVVRGEGEIFAAYGRTADLRAWLSDATFNHITVEDDGEFVVRTMEPLPPTAEPEEDPAVPAVPDAPVTAPPETTAPEENADEREEPGRNPAGSDLWLDEFTDEDALIADMQLPEGMSVLIARDGIEDAPSDISVSWPLDNSTPWAGPLMVAGSVLMAVGIVLYFFAIRYQRRGRGPRRKGPGPLPPTEPINTELAAGERRDELTAGPEDSDEPAAEKNKTQRRRLTLALPALGISFALVTGCSADSWPQPTVSPTPSPSPTVIAPENQQSPAVTESQAVRILHRLSATVAAADEARDADLLATRMSGAPLAERKTDYTLRGAIPERQLPDPIPTDNLSILLPQAYDGWPRTVLMLSESEPAQEDAAEEATEEEAPEEAATEEEAAPEEEAPEEEAPASAPVIMTLVQESPWAPYKLTYFAEMQAAAELPGLAPAWLGTQLIPPASPFLSLAPEDLSAAFADVVDKGNESEFAEAFDDTAMALAQSVRDSRQSVTQALADAGASNTSAAEFGMITTDHPPIALGTLDSGAIVAVDLVDTEKVTPTTSDAVIRLGDNAEAKTLTGVSETAKGVDTRYSMQLFFSVPSQGSSEPIRLLAAHQTLLSVTVIQ